MQRVRYASEVTSGLGSPHARGGAPTSALLPRCEADPDLFAAFYDAYSERILRFLVRRLLDAEVALDLMSETFAKALRRRRQFRGKTAEEELSWLFAIASSELSHYWRHGKAERKALQRIGVSVPALTDHELERIEERAGVQAIATTLMEELRGLPEDQRHAVELRVVRELTYDEIARAVGVSAQVVRARVSRGLRTLAKALRDRGIEPEAV